MHFFVIIFISLFNFVCLYDLCSVQSNICTERHVLDKCKVKSLNFDSRDCSQVQFTDSGRVRQNLGRILLEVVYDSSSQLVLNISFSAVKWKRAFIRLSDENNRNQNVCKMYTVEKDARLPLYSDLHDSCLWSTAKKLKAQTYLLEYKVETEENTMFKKILFDLMNINFFGDKIPLAKRLIFYYIDLTVNYEIILNIQALPVSYNITHYKVEIFREKDKKTSMMDIRMLDFYRKPNLVMDYPTYNEEGYYYFAISVLSDRCHADGCVKTITSKIYINRKGTPLVIGIVGASFIIPFVLFMFHMWNRRFKHQGLLDTVEKILILFNPSTDKHNEVVTTLAKTIKNLTGIEVMLDPVTLTKTKIKNSERWCSDNLILATHIIYVKPPCVEDSCQLDYMTYRFLKQETKKSLPEKHIIVLNFPYSTADLPPVLAGCKRFELMEDFHGFLNFLQPVSPDFNYEENINCVELMEKIRLAQAEIAASRNEVPPTIVVTDQSE